MSHFSLLVIGDNPEDQLDQFYGEKWDWFEIGGRWAGRLKLKPEYAHFGEPQEETWNSPEVPAGWCDQAFKDQLDFASMVPELSERAEQEFERIRSAIDGLEEPKGFEELKDIHKSLSQHVVVKLFWDQPFCNAIRELYPNSYFLDPMQLVGVEKESFVKTSVLRSIYPFFAILNHGEWFEQGSMGLWFGASDKQFNDHDWHNLIEKMVIEADEKSLLTVIDCHY